MKKLTKREYADLCGIKTKHLSTYISRGKVFVSKDGTIDKDHLLNRGFIQSKSVIKPGKSKKESKKKISPKSKSTKRSARKEEKVIYQEALLRFNTEKEKSELDIKIKQHTEEEKRMKNEKARREVVPTVLMKSVMTEYSAATRQAYYDGLDGFIILLSHKTKLSSKEESNFRKQLNELINNSDSKALDIAKKKVRIIVDEYSTKRGIGEIK